MGGVSFLNIGAGKNAQEAFRALADRALYEHGHGGYSGTIAEKPGFQLLSVPPGVAALDMANWVSSYVLPEYRDEPWNKDRKWKKYPDNLEHEVRRAYQVYTDKWGPAAAYEIKGEELEALKKQNDWRVQALKTMPAGSRVFVFFGFASS